MVCMVARQGRELQRYNEKTGGRIVVGCIPYRIKNDESVEVLVISSQKGHGMMFPKGGWEEDETIEEAVDREALEEAGVSGKLETMLGQFFYQSRRYGTTYEGLMFPLHVSQELEEWPEMGVRNRRWVSIAEAREGCQHLWMREALDVFSLQLQLSCIQQDNGLSMA